MSVSLLLLNLPPLKFPYWVKFSLNLWKLPQNVTRLYIQTPPPWKGFCYMDLRYFSFNWWKFLVWVSPFSFSFYGETCTSVIMIEVVGEFITGNKKPLQLRRGLMFLLRRVEDLNFCIQVKGWRISNPLHYHSANSPVRRMRDSNPQGREAAGFQNRCLTN